MSIQIIKVSPVQRNLCAAVTVKGQQCSKHHTTSIKVEGQAYEVCNTHAKNVKAVIGSLSRPIVNINQEEINMTESIAVKEETMECFSTKQGVVWHFRIDTEAPDSPLHAITVTCGCPDKGELYNSSDPSYGWEEFTNLLKKQLVPNRTDVYGRPIPPITPNQKRYIHRLWNAVKTYGFYGKPIPSTKTASQVLLAPWDRDSADLFINGMIRGLPWECVEARYHYAQQCWVDSRMITLLQEGKITREQYMHAQNRIEVLRKAAVDSIEGVIALMGYMDRYHDKVGQLIDQR